MPVKVESGRRSVQTEVEVPGTPEEVWKAIATGPGISSWFVPSTVEGKVGGKTTADFGFGPDQISQANVTVWNPPQRFVAESPGDLGPGDPTVATEWIVEARAGGTCIVRVVHSWVTDSDKWDGQFEQHAYGWKGFFKILRLYLTHFRGQTGVSLQFLPMLTGSKEDAWKRLAGPLGLVGAAAGTKMNAPAGAPPLAGVVEINGEPEIAEVSLVRLERPAPGIAHFFALALGGPVFLAARLYLFGPRAAAIAAEQEPIWKAWIGKHLTDPPAAPKPDAAAAQPG
jgi:uncharacterized protein YndB with AHSA1/START domain